MYISLIFIIEDWIIYVIILLDYFCQCAKLSFMILALSALG